MNINEFVDRAHENAAKHGFWEQHENLEKYDDILVSTGNMLMLVVGEVSEAHEALRKNDKENFKEELADIVIRVADMCGGLDIDLEYEIIKKMDTNSKRPYKHGKLF